MNPLQQSLSHHSDRRVVVVGTTCVGKSTLAKDIPGAVDVDEVLFPMLTEEEKIIVCQKPWTPEIGHYMDGLIQKKIKVIPGAPLFSPGIIDCDLVIYLRALYKSTLEKRCADRGESIHTAMAMDGMILKSLADNNIPTITIFVEECIKHE